MAKLAENSRFPSKYVSADGVAISTRNDKRTVFFIAHLVLEQTYHADAAEGKPGLSRGKRLISTIELKLAAVPAPGRPRQTPRRPAPARPTLNV